MTESEWLDDNRLSLDIWNNKYRHGNESFEEWLDRVSGHDPYIRELIRQKRFIFGGRILANRGTGTGSLSNCYSSGFVEDDLGSILETNTRIALTFKAQGGQGLSLSLIRPKGAKVRGVYESDGIIPFMQMFNTTTGCISQGSHRRGALLMSLDIWHREAESFIKVKSDLKAINNANLSLEIDDGFMQDVERYYTTGETVTREITRTYGGSTVTYEVTPIGLYRIMCEHARKYAEPGVFYTGRMRTYNLMQYHSVYRIESANPCGEQPLPKDGCCNLCSINLLSYVKNPFTEEAMIDYEALRNDLRHIVRAMDDIIDENLPYHALREQRLMAEKYRNVGIGIMGLHDLFIAKGVRYGSPESVTLARELMRFLFREAVKASTELASERGSFPGYESGIWDADIIRHNFSGEEITGLKALDRLRNCSLLTVAPTGSIGTMLSVSTGVEPYFALKYFRKTVSLNHDREQYYEVDASIVDRYRKTTGNTALPDCFLEAKDIPCKERIAVQSALQESVDTGISSTINLPKDTTQETVESLYLEAWRQGLKGVTIYVDGSRDPVLDTERRPAVQAPKRPESLPCDIYNVSSRGEQFTVCVGLYEGRPYEIFVIRKEDCPEIRERTGTVTKLRKGVYSLKAGEVTIPNILSGKLSIEEKAATLYSSMLLRHGVPIRHIIRTARKVDDNIISFSRTMCRVLSRYMPVETAGKCPECGNDLVHEGSCVHCMGCEYSRCD